MFLNQCVEIIQCKLSKSKQAKTSSNVSTAVQSSLKKMETGLTGIRCKSTFVVLATRIQKKIRSAATEINGFRRSA